jgi:D-alanine transaminase
MTRIKSIGYYNGKIGPIEELTMPITDRACYFGDGVYDVAYCNSGIMFAADEHIGRFFRSCEAIGIKLPYTKEELYTILSDLVSRVEGKETLIYFQASRGCAPRGHAFPANTTPSLMATVTQCPMTDPETLVDLTEAEDIRYLMCNIKTINLLPSVLASQKAAEKGCFETVLHRGEIVTECAHSNVSILKDGVLITHPADNYILPGIARSHLLEAARTLGVPVEERRYTMTELKNADEVLVSSTSKFCLAAKTLDGESIGGKDRETYRRLRAHMVDEFYAYIEAHK